MAKASKPAASKSAAAKPVASEAAAPDPAADAPRVAVIVAAHPDDGDFGAGGTASLWSQQGWEFHLVVATNGSKGSGDRQMTRERLISMREEEQRAAAAVYGVQTCTFLGGEDGELDYSRLMLGKIVREIRKRKPYAVFTHATQELHRSLFRAVEGEADAEFIGFVNHRDHRMTGTMAVDAVYPTARDHMNFSEQIDMEGLETHKVKELYIWGSNEANFRVDISDAVDQKLRGLSKHLSQFGDRNEGFLDEVRQRWRDADGHYYERFLRLVLPR